MKNFIYSVLFVFHAIVSSAQVAGNENIEAVEITNNAFTNLYKISDKLYRSEQPVREGLPEINRLEIFTILNLRRNQTDFKLLEKSEVKLVHLPINTKKISFDDVLKALVIIRDSEKPILVHCKHGSDRTGCIIAAYRMVFENWSKSDAIKEFEDKKYGYHYVWFPNILELLNTLDIMRLKKELGLM